MAAIGPKKIGGDKPNEILNWQDHADWFNNRAVFSDDPRYNDLIKKLTLAGTHGFNPTTGTLHKLETPVTVNQDVVENVTEGTAKGKKFAEVEEKKKNWQDGRELVHIDSSEYWSPDFNFEVPSGTANANDFRGQQVYMTPQEAEDYRKAMLTHNYVKTWTSPAAKAPGYAFLSVTAPWLLAGMSAVEAADDVSKGNYTDAAFSAAGALPFVPSGVRGVKNATKHIPAKINPKYYNPKTIAKGNSDVYYRTAGKDAFDDFQKSGFLRTKAEVTENPIRGLLDTKKQMDEVRANIRSVGGRGMTYRHHENFRAPYFSRGKTATMTSGGDDYLFQTRPEVVGHDAFSSGQMNVLHGVGNTQVAPGGYGLLNPMQRSAENFDVYKKSWWHGYKPVTLKSWSK